MVGWRDDSRALAADWSGGSFVYIIPSFGGSFSIKIPSESFDGPSRSSGESEAPIIEDISGRAS